MSKEISRRSFLKAGTAAAVGLSMAPGMFAAP
ncbi:MAG: twin-arginine translocation signal domain-containing protein, partial [Candidatus Cryptobacteroides sp.]